MLIDITLKITPKMIADAQKMENKSLAGHLGTHFDVMDKEFPLEYTKRNAVIFDVSDVTGRDMKQIVTEYEVLKAGEKSLLKVLLHTGHKQLKMSIKLLAPEINM